MGNPQASPCPVMLNGTEYLMSPLSDKAIGEVNNRIKQEVLSNARKSLGDETNQQIIDSIMKVAIEKSMEVDWMQDPEKWMNGQNLLYMFFLCVKLSNGEADFESFVKDLLADEEGIDKCYDTFLILQPFLSGTAGNSKKARMPKKEKIRQQKKKSTSS